MLPNRDDDHAKYHSLKGARVGVGLTRRLGRILHLLQVTSEPFGVSCSLVVGHELSPSRVELVFRIARRYMHMIMPYILISSRLIVLASGYAVARINRFQRQGHPSSNSVNVNGIVDGQVVDILKMLIGHNDDVTMIVRPLMRTNKGGDDRVVVDNVALH